MTSNSVPKYDWDHIAELTRQGNSAREIADLVGCSIRQVQRVRMKTGTNLPRNAPSSPPDTPELRAHIEQLIADRVSHRDIRRITGVSDRWLTKNYPGTALTHKELGQYRAILWKLWRIENDLPLHAA